ncbi:hypothetical protein ACI3LY_003367 [Candidozyma auris]|uniref:Glutathione S-transferase n=3 Tax=Candidozyma auris TaxID=498019 RepID=A0A2H0ZV25_CANAR|nr:hypothetical_protein [[Candida] auris]PIS52447.1 hypothetical protein B9J08_004064 [[Candida] auris]PIS54428.1 hypothetical protein CJI97_004132 [[Candida] auris]QEO21741.1 hypothetical_protein [[Candida] auris]QWW21292.1 hypothetical protein CA7LBN_000038 [[Candida] auris]GBL47762.1 putative maleylacetoacetate isomerase [[Candida] auris]
MPDKFLLHYLTNSRASRIVWLLEELELDFELKVYHRVHGVTAPKELLNVFPTGMSPVLQIFKEGSSEPLTLAESGHIIQYVIDHYDHKGKLIPDSEADKEKVGYYLHFAEGSLQPHLVSMIVGEVACQRAPWPAKYLVKFIVSKMNSEYYVKRLKTNLNFLEDTLAKKEGGFFVGDKLTGADIILEYPIVQDLFSDPVRAKNLGLNVKLEEAFPHLYEWTKLIASLPIRQKAMATEKANL